MEAVGFYFGSSLVVYQTRRRYFQNECNPTADDLKNPGLTFT